MQEVIRPVIVKKGSSAQYLSCKVLRDWSIIKLWEKSYLLDVYIFAALFETTSHSFC